LSEEKMWDSEPYWGLRYDWDRGATGTHALAEKLLAQAAEDEAKQPIGR
jgi:hypothetical protein